MRKVLKNTTVSEITISEVGITIPADDSYTIDAVNYTLWASAIVFSINDASLLVNSINDGDLVVNDGTNDLSPNDGINFLKYPDDAWNTRFKSEPERSNDFISKTVQEAIEEAATKGPVVGNLSKMFQGIDTTGGMKVTNVAKVIEFDYVSLKDSYYSHSTTVNAGEIEFLNSGWFKFTAITTIETLDASQGARGNPRLHIQLDSGSGWVTQPDNMGGYIRENAAGKLSCSITGVGIFYMEVGWKIRITVLDSVASEPNEATVPYSSRLLIEYKDRTGSASGSVDNLSDVGDVGATAPNNAEVLTYDGETSTWMSAVLPDVGLVRNFYVAKNGNDVTGNGTMSRPFLTIKACIDYINANYTLSATFNAIIHVAAGEYLELPFILPAFCSLWGAHYRTRVDAITSDAHLLTTAGKHTIRGIIFSGVTSTSHSHINASGTEDARLLLQDIGILKYEVAGVISNGIFVESSSGTFRVECKNLDFDDVQGNCIEVGTGGNLALYGSQVFSCPNATYLKTTGFGSATIDEVSVSTSLGTGVDHQSLIPVSVVNSNFINANVPIKKTGSGLLNLSGPVFNLDDCQIDDLSMVTGFFFDVATGNATFRTFSNLAVGNTRKGSEFTSGEGDNYVAKMLVYTSDGTDTATTEGNLTDVSDKARHVDSDNVEFEGTTANHCIYVVSTDENEAFGSLDKARIMGIRIRQVAACLETVNKSIVFESWDGSSYVEGSIFAIEAEKTYRYANNAFIRANSFEDIKFGKNLIAYNNVKKTIEGQEGYWIRIRIKNNVTTAPTFNQISISNNHLKIGVDGTLNLSGRARYTKALAFQANTFGESGGVTNSSFEVGGGVAPIGNWNHVMKNNRLNGEGDAIFATGILPEGICTSCPLTVKVKYKVLKDGASTDGQLNLSLVISEALGVLVADPSGGIAPIARTTSIATKDSEAVVQNFSETIDLETYDYTITSESQEFNISDYYEGDIIMLRIEYHDYGSGKKPIAIIGVDMEYVAWTLGNKA
jgi:hypothetical protein